MQNEQALYERWMSQKLEDMDLEVELKEIQNNPDEIFDRFYRELTFGTAGLRGVIGAGTNRMNIYTVRRATQGLSDHLLESKCRASVVISYDSRIKSELFAKEAARTLASNGIKVYITNRLMPTPVLSFCVRHLKCDAGIMITASHNPAKYNGYKVYGKDGSQLNAKNSDKVFEKIEKIDIFGANTSVSFDEGLSNGSITYVDEEVYANYFSLVTSLSINPDVIEKAQLKLAYTPLNGTGNEPVRKVLRVMGVKNISVVAVQEFPDGNFPSCPYPNPEIAEALTLGIELLCKKDGDILVATDPDADRVGVVVRDKNGDCKILSGNEVGVLLCEYILSQRSAKGTLPKDPVVVKSLVSSSLADRVCEDYGIEMKNVFTGFRFIGEEILKLENIEQSERFVFGFEESCGYLSGDFVRDKDAVIATMLIAEMASFYKLQDKTLLDVLKEIESRHGVYYHKCESFAFEGAAGMKKMQGIMQALRDNTPGQIAGFKTVSATDYLSSKKTDLVSGEVADLGLESSNVLQFNLEGNGMVIVRPSGTEPKIKFYYTVVSDSREKAEQICDGFKAFARETIK